MNFNLLHFVPRAELNAQQNLSLFIETCKRSAVLNACNQFESDTWDIGSLKARNGVHRAIFSTLEAAQASTTTPSLPEQFIDFAKAILVYLHDRRPVVSVGVRVSALRYLESALREWGKGSRPTAVSIEVLDTAVRIARDSLSPDVAYRVAGQLEHIAELMNEHGFIRLRQNWKSGLKKPSSLGSRISEAALQARQDKLPSAASLRALGGIFKDAITPLDIMVSSYAALMLCAPDRINEVLRMQRNCFVHGEGRDAGKLGLRWAGSKGSENTVKWLPTEMKDVAQEAVSKILKTTAKAHALTKWYTTHPTRLFLHEDAAHLRTQEVLSSKEVGLVLWGDENAFVAANVWAQTTNKLAKIPLEGRRVGYAFKDVESAVVSMLPNTFPFMPGDPSLYCENALAVCLTNEVHQNRANYLCMFSCVDNQTITAPLGDRPDRKSIFERFDYKEDDGSSISLRSHSFRHYLNMLGQMGGLSSAEIAIFSGRKDERQNRAYDHRTSEELQAPISTAIDAGFTGNLVVHNSRNLISREQFLVQGVVAAHTTEYGWCMHNFASEPCQMYRDCINCEEQECIKGDEQKEANLRKLEKETIYLLNEAKQALSEEEYGADNWVKHQSTTLDRIQAMLKILADPSVQNGARFRLDVSNAPLITNDLMQTINLTKRLGSK